MARYIRKITRVGSAGPTEERGFAIWAGYELEGTDGDLSECGLLNVEGWPPEQLAPYGVVAFLKVTRDDEATRKKLGLGDATPGGR